MMRSLSWQSFPGVEMLDAVRLQQQDFSVEQELAALRAGSMRMGGIATFIGCARDFSASDFLQEREVSKLSFDAYPSMALAEMNKLRDEAIEKFDLLDARIVHRVGVIGAGEQIVLIATGAEHRAPALQACNWLIDKLKQRVPIWKKEITPQGDVWVTAHP
jgi:molybdopterin synthase catalytic subunit